MGPLLLLKVSVLLSLTLIAARLLKRVPATTRHGLWSVAFGSLLMLAPLAALLPSLRVPVPAAWESSAAKTMPSIQAPVTSSIDSPTPAVSKPIEASTVVEPIRSVLPSTRTRTWPSASSIFLTAWAIGMCAAVVSVLLSLLRVRRLIHTAEVLADRDWQNLATAIGGQLGIRNPVRLLVSPRVGTPMAGGVFRPAIFLPPSASSWSAEHRELVLAHELAHLSGRDPLRHLMTRFALACYWFHPLAWLAAREAAIAREQACDETVLAMGARPSAYARVLLDLAESISVPGPPRFLGALPMVHRSHLEKRLMAILNVDVRPATRRMIVGPAIGIALLTLSVAAAQPALSEVHANEVAQYAQEHALPFAEKYAKPFAETYAKPFAETQARPFAEKHARPVAEAIAGIMGSAPAALVEDAPVVEIQGGRDSACVWESGRGSFTGSRSSTDVGGRTVVTDMVGSSDGDRIIQRSFGDLKLCMLAEGVGDRDNAGQPSQWIGRARRIVVEAHRASSVQRLEVAGSRTSWQVNSSSRDFDSAAQTWRDRMLAVLDITWELSSLRGEESALRGQISAIQGERSALQGEISALQGAVSAMHGRISAAQGEESSLRGQISAIRGHVSALQGKISAEQGAISRLRVGWSAPGSRPVVNARTLGIDTVIDAQERNRIATEISDHELVIARIQREIRDYGAEQRVAAVQKQIDALDTAAKVSSIERDIRDFDLDRKVAAVERRIAGLNVDGKVRDIERQIERLDVARRARQLEDRLDAELPRLTAAISAIR